MSFIIDFLDFLFDIMMEIIEASMEVGDSIGWIKLIIGFLVIFPIIFLLPKPLYPYNHFIHYVLNPPRHIVEERKNLKILNEDETDEIMDISKFSHPEYLREDYDCIIIGSGLSGLTTAGLLSRAGKKCLILEAHDRFGGCCHTYEEKGFTFCTGIHFVSDAEHPMLDWTMKMISEYQLEFISMAEEESEAYFYGDDPVMIKGHHTLESLHRHFVKLFPHEKEGLEKFFYHAMKCSDAFEHFYAARCTPFPASAWLKYLQGWEDAFHKYGKYSADDILDLCGIQTDVLRSMINANATLFLTHHQRNFIFPVCVLLLQIGWKKYKINGGGGTFPRKIIPYLKNDSKAIHSCQVKSILFQKGGNRKAVGVQLTTGEKIYAEHIISSTSIESTERLLPRQIAEKTVLPKVVEDFEYTGHFFTIHLGLDSTPLECGFPYNQVTICSGEDRKKVLSFGKFFIDHKDFEGLEKNHYIGAITDYNDEKTPKITILTYCFWEGFEEFSDTETGKRGNEYEERKERLTNIILDIFYSKFPTVEEHVTFMDSGTHLTSRDYYFNGSGSGYGLLCTYDKLNYIVGNKKVINPCENLYLVGQDLFSDGVLAVVMSSFPAVGYILKRNLFWDFQDAKDFKEKKLKKTV